MMTEMSLELINFFNNLPVEIQHKIITVILVIALIGFIALSIYIFRED